MIPHDAKILITGAAGLVGSALTAELRKEGYNNLTPLTREVCDLTDLAAVIKVFKSAKPDVMFHIAASVYGIGGNLKNRGSIFLNNTLMNTHVIEASRLVGVKKIIAMGTVAAYPPPAVTPIKEEHIWDGPPHASESSYGHAKRAMLAQLEAYLENYGLQFAYVISTNLYGPCDRFDPKYGHVIPSLVQKFYEAKQKESVVEVWGDGSAARDFLYSKDMARALVLMMNKGAGAINIASGKKSLIKEVVHILTECFGMEGRVRWDASMPNGRDYHPLDLTKMKALSFGPHYSLSDGLRETVNWFVENFK